MAGPVNIPTVTVLNSEVVIGLDGTTALVLHTKEHGPIAFAVDADATAGLRDSLDKLETAFGSLRGRA
jgi:hypothetical protein